MPLVVFNLKPFSDDLLSGLESRRIKFKSERAVQCRTGLHLTHTPFKTKRAAWMAARLIVPLFI